MQIDYEKLAHEKLPHMACDYYASGACDEITLRDNRLAYDCIRLLYHVLRDVSERDLSIELLGHPISMPVVIAPSAFHAIAHKEGGTGNSSCGWKRWNNHDLKHAFEFFSRRCCVSS